MANLILSAGAEASVLVQAQISTDPASIFKTAGQLAGEGNPQNDFSKLFTSVPEVSADTDVSQHVNVPKLKPQPLPSADMATHVFTEMPANIPGQMTEPSQVEAIVPQRGTEPIQGGRTLEDLGNPEKRLRERPSPTTVLPGPGKIEPNQESISKNPTKIEAIVGTTEPRQATRAAHSLNLPEERPSPLGALERPTERRAASPFATVASSPTPPGVANVQLPLNARPPSREDLPTKGPRQPIEPGPDTARSHTSPTPDIRTDALRRTPVTVSDPAKPLQPIVSSPEQSVTRAEFKLTTDFERSLATQYLPPAAAMPSQAQGQVAAAAPLKPISLTDTTTLKPIAPFEPIHPMAEPNLVERPQHTIHSRPEFGRFVIQQLSNNLSINLAERPIEIRLEPAELGRVRLTLSTTEAGVTVTVLAERAETLELMRRNASELASEFRELGFAGVDLSFGQRAEAEERQGAVDDAGNQDEEATGTLAEPVIPAILSLGLPEAGRMDLRI